MTPHEKQDYWVSSEEHNQRIDEAQSSGFWAGMVTASITIALFYFLYTVTQ